MNKTININLANTFFHIDEEAYGKLQDYLEAIRRSFSQTEGKEEILADIEARIAEIFGEKMQHSRQVISMKEVDEMIGIMGQPEDYLVDEELFEEPQSRRSYTGAAPKGNKKLYRDMEQKYIGGVCAGLEHYLGIDALWIRLIFLFTAVFSGFGFIAYFLLWILVPEAKTTAEKIAMTGEPVNISNIEKKIRESMEAVGENLRKVDYDKVGEQVKKGSRNIFDSIGSVLLFLLRLVGKFIGILLVLVAATTLIGIFISFFTVGSLDFMGDIPLSDLAVMSIDAPVWLVLLLAFFAIGIPFFMLFYLGLRILVSNLNPMGTVAKMSLFGLWLMAVIGLTILGVRTAADRATEGMVSETEQLNLSGIDTLKVRMADARYNSTMVWGNQRFEVIEENGEKLIYLEEVNIGIEKTEQSAPYVEVHKSSRGRNMDQAVKLSEAIEYPFRIIGPELELGGYLTTPLVNKFRDQEVDITLYLSEGSKVFLDGNTYSHLKRSRNDQYFSGYHLANHLWEMKADGELKCLDCVSEATEEAPTETPADSL